IVNNEKELLFFSEYIDNPLIQEYILGEEYTIDVCLNFDSTPVSIVPRKRIATRGGEILKGQIIKDRELIETTKKMLEKLNAIGHITIQCIKNEKGIFYLEINARYGGGAPISIKSGANSPEYIIKMIDSKKNLRYRENYLDKMIALRYDQAIYLDEKGNVYND
ncbi:ATP-grasp domain-containing protein, partial [Enterococcus faecium]|nr:ATP-grasp domain-containing protein [Enterococcus faecium]